MAIIDLKPKSIRVNSSGAIKASGKIAAQIATSAMEAVNVSAKESNDKYKEKPEKLIRESRQDQPDKEA